MAQGIKRLEIARRCDRANRRWKYFFKYMYQRESVYAGTCQRGRVLFSRRQTGGGGLGIAVRFTKACTDAGVRRLTGHSYSCEKAWEGMREALRPLYCPPGVQPDQDLNTRGPTPSAHFL